MKISSNELRAMILEELKAVRGETLTENEEVVEAGGYGSPRGRAEADENFDQAVQTLIDLLGVTRDRAITAVQSLRGGAEAGDHWTANMNTGSPDARLRREVEELDAMSGVPDAPAGQEDLDEDDCLSDDEEVEELDESRIIRESADMKTAAELAKVLAQSPEIMAKLEKAVKDPKVQKELQKADASLSESENMTEDISGHVPGRREDEAYLDPKERGRREQERAAANLGAGIIGVGAAASLAPGIAAAIGGAGAVGALGATLGLLGGPALMALGVLAYEIYKPDDVHEGLSLADEMEGHIDSAREEEGLQTVQESFSERRLARLAGILED